MTDPFKQLWDEDDTPDTPKEIAPFTYPPSLPHDLACCVSDEDVEAQALKYELSASEMDYITQLPLFKREYAEWRQRLISEGNSFKLKLRAMAEEYLPALHRLMGSELTAPSVKMDAFKYITKVAGLEPPKELGEGGPNGPKIVIEIANYAAPAAPTTVNVTPRVIPEGGEA